jgi:hypothetical protein
MRTMFPLKNLLNLTLILSLSLYSLGCNYSVPRPTGNKLSRKVFYFPTRKNAPFPSYNRLLTVLSPGPIPEDDLRNASLAPVLQPEYSLNAVNKDLEAVASQLAAVLGYSSYCSSKISNMKVSFSQRGSIDAIVAELAKRYNFTAVVNHQEGRISFFSGAWKG